MRTTLMIKHLVAPRDIIKDASVKMEKSLASLTFTNPKVREAAVALVDRMKNNTRNSFGHFVAVDVHDSESIEMGWPLADVMKPGTGVENLTASLPREPEEIERLMAQPSPFSKPKAGTQEIAVCR